jgi:hypothetical protein
MTTKCAHCIKPARGTLQRDICASRRRGLGPSAAWCECSHPRVLISEKCQLGLHYSSLRSLQALPSLSLLCRTGKCALCRTGVTRKGRFVILECMHMQISDPWCQPLKPLRMHSRELEVRKTAVCPTACLTVLRRMLTVQMDLLAAP